MPIEKSTTTSKDISTQPQPVIDIGGVFYPLNMKKFADPDEERDTSYIQHKLDNEKKKDLKKLVETINKYEKKLSDSQLEELNTLAETYATTATQDEFLTAILDSFATRPMFAEISVYVGKTKDQTKHILETEFESHLDFKEQCINLLEQSIKLNDGTNASLANILGIKIATELNLLIRNLDKRNVRYERQKSRIMALLGGVDQVLSSPSTIISIIIDVKKKLPNDSKLNQSLEMLDTFAASLDPIQSYQKIVFTLDEIKNNSNLEPAERDYVRAVTCKLLVDANNCPASWAAELAAGKEIFATTNINTVIQALLYPYEKVDSVDTDYRLKQLNKLLLTLLLSAQLLSTPQAVKEIAADVVNTTASIIEFIENFSIDLVNIPDFNMIPEPLVEEEIVDTAILKPEINQMDRILEEFKPLEAKDMTWSKTTTENKTGISSSATVSPEQLKNQRSLIAWEIKKQPDNQTDATYLFQRVLPIYIESTSTFQPYAEAESNINQYFVDSDISNSDYQISATRTTINPKTLIPGPWGYQIYAAKVSIEKNGQVIELPVSAGVTADSSNYLIINSGEAYEVKVGEILIIEVGFSKVMHSNFDPQILYVDQDAKLSDKNLIPANLMALIDELNTNDSYSDQEKLEKVREWFLANFEYSVNPDINNYYTNNRPSTAQQIGRIFGTGSAETDVGFSDAPNLRLKGICSSVNNLYSAVARHLHLIDGQIVQVSGYINAPFFTNNQQLLTEGQYHAWSVYINNFGEMNILDATPNKLEEQTNKIFDILDQDEVLISEQLAEVEVEGKRFESNFATAFPDLFEAPILDASFETMIEYYPSPMKRADDWHVAAMFTGGLNHSLQNAGTAPIYTKMENGRWIFPVASFPIDIEYSLNKKPYYKDSEIIKVETTRKLTRNALWLTSKDLVDPTTIIVERLLGGDTNSRFPVKINNLSGSKNFESYGSQLGYILTLDATEEQIKNDTFHIKYETLVIPSRFDVLKKNVVEEIAKAQIDRNVLGLELNALLSFIDTNPTVGEVKKSTYLKDIEHFHFNGNDDEQLINFDITRLLSLYLREKFIATFSSDWSDLYHYGNPDNNEYVRRIVTHRRLDANTFIDLLAAIVSTIPDHNDGDKNIKQNIPFVIKYKHSSFHKIVSISGQRLQPDFYDPSSRTYEYDNKSLVSTLSIIHIRRDGNYVIGPAFSFYEWLGDDHLRPPQHSQSAPKESLFPPPPYDKISLEKARALFLKVIDYKYGKNAFKDIDEFARSNAQALDRDPNSYASYLNTFFKDENNIAELWWEITREYSEIEFYKWFYERGRNGVLLEMGLAAIVGFVLGDWVRRRTSWMRGFKKDMIEQILDEAIRKFGKNAETTAIYQDLKDFLEQVVIPSDKVRRPLRGIIKARKLRIYKSQRPSNSVFADRAYGYIPNLEGAKAFLHRKTLHALQETFASEEGNYVIQARFGNEVTAILESRGWRVDSMLSELQKILILKTKDKAFGITNSILASDDQLEKNLLNIEQLCQESMISIINKSLKETNAQTSLNSDDQTFIHELSSTIVRSIFLPYIRKVLQEKALLKQKK